MSSTELHLLTICYYDNTPIWKYQQKKEDKNVNVFQLGNKFN